MNFLFEIIFGFQNFAKNILSILNSIKAKEESEPKQEALAAQRSPVRDVSFSILNILGTINVTFTFLYLLLK